MIQVNILIYGKQKKSLTIISLNILRQGYLWPNTTQNMRKNILNTKIK